MAKHQFCTFFLSRFFFGIDVQQIQEVIRLQTMTSVPLSPPDICGLVNLRGNIVTVVDLRRRLELPDDAVEPIGFSLLDQTDSVAAGLVDEDSQSISGTKAGGRSTVQPPDQQQFCIVVRVHDEVISLLIDQVGEVLEVDADDFEPPPATLKGKIRQVLSGAYSLQDGFLLILNAEKILAAKLNNFAEVSGNLSAGESSSSSVSHSTSQVV